MSHGTPSDRLMGPRPNVETEERSQDFESTMKQMQRNLAYDYVYINKVGTVMDRDWKRSMRTRLGYCATCAGVPVQLFDHADSFFKSVWMVRGPRSASNECFNGVCLVCNPSKGPIIGSDQEAKPEIGETPSIYSTPSKATGRGTTKCKGPSHQRSSSRSLDSSLFKNANGFGSNRSLISPKTPKWPRIFPSSNSSKRRSGSLRRFFRGSPDSKTQSFDDSGRLECRLERQFCHAQKDEDNLDDIRDDLNSVFASRELRSDAVCVNSPYVSSAQKCSPGKYTTRSEDKATNISKANPVKAKEKKTVALHEARLLRDITARNFDTFRPGRSASAPTGLSSKSATALPRCHGNMEPNHLIYQPPASIEENQEEGMWLTSCIPNGEDYRDSAENPQDQFKRQGGDRGANNAPGRSDHSTLTSNEKPNGTTHMQIKNDEYKAATVVLDEETLINDLPIDFYIHSDTTEAEIKLVISSISCTMEKYSNNTTILVSCMRKVLKICNTGCRNNLVVARSGLFGKVVDSMINFVAIEEVQEVGSSVIRSLALVHQHLV